MKVTVRKCQHEEWCKNKAAFVVCGSDVCSVHLASACRFNLDLSELIFGDHREVTLNGVA